MRASSIPLLALVLSAIAPDHLTAQPGSAGQIYATFEKNGENQELIGLAVGDIIPGSKITLNCTGPSCQFESKTINITSVVKMLALTDLFVDTSLKPGTKIEVRVAPPRGTGRVVKYEIRPKGDPTKRRCACRLGRLTQSRAD
jgi:hypothetical protein